MCCSRSLSFSFSKKKRHGLSRKKYGHMKVQVLKKKEKKMWAHEGPWKKRYPCSQNNLYRERDHTKGVSIPSTIIHTLAHLDLIVWLDFLFGSGLWLCNTCDTSMPYPPPWAPHIAIIRGRMKERQVKCLGEDTYTLSDLRESNEEQSKVCFENLLKNPKILDIRSWSDLIQDHSIPQSPKMVW